MDFPAGAMLTVNRRSKSYTPLGDVEVFDSSHTIGPCAILDSHGTIQPDNDGYSKWVGTVTVSAPPESDVRVSDEIRLPNGDKGIIVQPPTRPVNPFTGWTPFLTFVLATPGYTPERG